MLKNLKFSHKILLAASLVVLGAFSLFTFYNDYLQRTAIAADIESHLSEVGDLSSRNIEGWLSGRILLLENAAQSIANNSGFYQVAHLFE